MNFSESAVYSSEQQSYDYELLFFCVFFFSSFTEGGNEVKVDLSSPAL